MSKYEPNFMRVRTTLLEGEDINKITFVDLILKAEERGLMTSYFLDDEMPLTLPGTTVFGVLKDGTLEWRDEG